MEGSLEPAIDGSLGMVNEYDFETKELIKIIKISTKEFGS